MAIREDAWLSERLERAVYTVDAGTDAAEVEAHEARLPALYQAKLPTDDIGGARALVGVGFYPVDVNVTLRRPPSGEIAPQRFRIVHAGAEHRDAVLSIASSCFRFSRFHLDPAISRSAADRVKREWMASYFAGTRGDHVLVALEGDEPIGFLGVVSRATPSGERVQAIDLIGVASAGQGRGAGRDLTGAFMAEAEGACDAVEVGTQAANLRATRFYERLGFAVERTLYVLHRHVGGGVA